MSEKPTIREQRIEIAARAIADHSAWRLGMPEGDPNGPMDEDYEVAQAVIVALESAALSVVSEQEVEAAARVRELAEQGPTDDELHDWAKRSLHDGGDPCVAMLAAIVQNVRNAARGVLVEQERTAQ